MSAAVCEMSDLPADSCAHCLGIKDETQEPERLVQWLDSARFPSVCPTCDERIEVGTPIVLSSRRGWVHSDCWERRTA